MSLSGQLWIVLSCWGAAVTLTGRDDLFYLLVSPLTRWLTPQACLSNDRGPSRAESCVVDEEGPIDAGLPRVSPTMSAVEGAPVRGQLEVSFHSNF